MSPWGSTKSQSPLQNGNFPCNIMNNGGGMIVPLSAQRSLIIFLILQMLKVHCVVFSDERKALKMLWSEELPQHIFDVVVSFFPSLFKQILIRRKGT